MGGEEFTGFVYAIYDKVMKSGYIGKKSFRSNSVRTGRNETNWRRYKSSSNLLKVFFKERPVDEFDFICLGQYKAKGALSYAETWSLCAVEAPTSNRWYNTRIEKVSWNVRERVSDFHKKRLWDIMNEMEVK
jgi:hypothetical protein